MRVCLVEKACDEGGRVGGEVVKKCLGGSLNPIVEITACHWRSIGNGHKVSLTMSECYLPQGRPRVFEVDPPSESGGNDFSILVPSPRRHFGNRVAANLKN